MKSWKTSLGGTLTAAGAALMGATTFDWIRPEHKYWCTFAGFLLTVAGPLFLGLFARDNNVTSEEAGAIRTTRPVTPPLPAVCALATGLALGTGCARFSTHQTDVSQDTNGTTRTITTHAAAYTFLEAKSALANWKASQTDKTQGASVGTLNQEAQATNTINLLNGAIEAAVGAAVKAAKP